MAELLGICVGPFFFNSVFGKFGFKAKIFFFPRLTFCLAFQGPEFLDITQISSGLFFFLTIGCFGWVYGYSMV